MNRPFPDRPAGSSVAALTLRKPPRCLIRSQISRSRKKGADIVSSRERIHKALTHQTPDRIPVDFGGSTVTGAHVACVQALRDHFGLERRPVRVIEPHQMLGEIADDLAEVLGIDSAGLYPRETLFGFPNDGWREYRTPWGQEVLVPGQFRTAEDGDGGLLIYPQGDTAAPPSARMPAGGFSFHTIDRRTPVDEEHLRVEDNLEEFTPVSEAALGYYAAQARRLKAKGRGVLAAFNGTAFGDEVMVPAPFLRHPKGIRDIEEWYASTLTRRDHLHEIFARQCDIAVKNLVRIRTALGDAADAVFLCGTDFGTQRSTVLSPQTFDELYAPHYRRLNGWIHGHTTWKTFKHSCGAVEALFPRFIESGFDIINPVQCSAGGMDPARLKERYGGRLVFWGGGVDVRGVLESGAPAEVRARVLERCGIFSAGGGFVFAADDNLPAGAPVENIVAVFDAVREFNGQS
jgi:hypothetical protein